MRFLLVLFIEGVSATKAVYAAHRVALDGLGTYAACRAVVFTTNNPACDTQSLTTARGNDVIILVAECGFSLDCSISSITDSTGLTFTQRISYTPIDKLWEYYARATDPLKSDNITVVFSPGGLHGIQVLAIHGANTRAIFDTNPSIPATVSCPGPACGNCSFNVGTCSASIQTSTIDFVIAATAIDDGPACGGYHGYFGGVPGFTTLTTNAGYSGWFEVDYAITTTPQTTVVFNCNGTFATAIVVDTISLRGAFGISSR